MQDCKTSLTNVLTHGERLQSCQFIAPSLCCLGEHLRFIPVSINRLRFWVGKLCHITELQLISQLGEVGKDESQFLSLQDVCSTSEGHHHCSEVTKESPCQCIACVQPPGPEAWREERGEAFLVCVGKQTGQLCVGGAWLLCPCGRLGRGTDSPGERAQEAAGPELSSGPCFSQSPAFAGRYWWIM